ncbi:tubulin glycylase 3A isoform X1 [Nasonia vitripennis]|uniref:ATP-grasp domain-containing protein n=1 Tax=Nasonia vitripennis TaxID=7425 RepID=A0A7M7H4D2_NASVI|nr:tubulin glycylase 3A isoform X1 [Nasonia vitripennis]
MSDEPAPPIAAAADPSSGADRQQALPPTTIVPVPELIVTNHDDESEKKEDATNGKDATTAAVPQQNNKPSQANEQMEHFVRIKELVKKAIAAKHTFMIHGRSRVVRECLLSRGWCEKLQRKNGNHVGFAGEQQIGVDSHPSTLLAGIGNLNERQNERLLISKMLSNHTVDFLWNAGSEWTGWPSQDNKNTIFNRFSRANFTSKVGLCSNVRQMHWYYEAGIANTLFPRCYNISLPDQMHAFIEDYRLTACLSLLKWLVDKTKLGGEEAVRSSGGSVPPRALDFAIARCSDLIGSKSHEDIDQELEKVWSHQWDQFITWYYKLLHGNALFIANTVPMNKYTQAARHLLKKAKKFWPQLDMDGTMNIWILKPGNKSRGRGIILINKLDDILAKVNPTNKSTDARFVIQKYIERPLLIYETKFDIRQWFIVTNAQPLTLWMYRESYLRFCSQKFSLTDFHESIHLSNNAVQCKYKNSPDRDAALPAENMWDVATFKAYLKSRGEEDAWDELIYPGMKQGLVGSLLASQDAMDRRKNSFELYGADFMVMEDFSVWLIEINSHPDMSNSTSVTTRLVRKVMEDIIKVVIDHREDSSADTGDFELVYKQKVSSCQAYLGSGLSLHGTRILLGEKRAEKASVNSNVITASLGKRKAATGTVAPPPTAASPRMGPAMVDLIEKLELQLDNEFYEYLKLRSAPANGKLSRQLLPLPAPELLNNTNNNSDKNFLDGETNTRHFNLNLTSSQTALNTPASTSPVNGHRNVAGKLSRNSTKNSPSKKPTKSKPTTVPQTKNTEAIDTSQTAKTIMSKIMDLRKETTTKSKSATPSNVSKLYRVIRAPENSAINNKLMAATDSRSTKSQKTDKKEKMPVNTKVIPLIPSGLILSGKKKEKQISRSAVPDGSKPSHAKRRDRALSSQIMVDVKDMYAVGLAVNK